ncbi:MAG: type Z 30S ribosomal protein S14 [Candidatus Doudnabacteria bacterium]|nr:type Z 30S ribosomal protein S14 [Candidatus Doudnabacteria bacterium]MCA9387428.1 type Z 30S ribosomal protein S14 [Candidatus Andersenbacteria bacterium]
MSKQSLQARARKKPKFSTRGFNTCGMCGRTRAYMRRYGICRICFREHANKGEIPGVSKVSW